MILIKGFKLGLPSEVNQELKRFLEGYRSVFAMALQV